MNNKKIISFFVILFGALSFGFGQSIFSNSITDTNPSAFNPYTNGQIVDPNIGVSGIGRGSGLNAPPGNTADRYNARSWLATYDSTRYFYFTITPNPGYEIDFSSLTYTGESSNQGPTLIAIRSSLDGYSTNIGAPTITGTTINLSSTNYQNISTGITFRIYAWGGTNGNGTFSINDFIFNGTVTPIPCVAISTWNGTSWSPMAPNASRTAVINGNYRTNSNGSFMACRLTVNPGVRLTVDNMTYLEIENDVIVNGQLYVETQGNFVQNSNSATFTLNAGGQSLVNKTTATKQAWYYYTYWSSPVFGETIDGAFPDTDANRRFGFNANNYLDINGDDIDDNNNDWAIVSGTQVMSPGVGYAATSSKFGFYPGTDSASFEGPFNTGDIVTSISYNALNVLSSWNFIGNPYPSALNFDEFYSANSSVIDAAAYFWSQASPPLNSNPGNQVENFNQNDYATYTVGTGGAAGASGVIPNGYIPSGQGFFIGGLTNGNATFSNYMRETLTTSNTQFFRSSKPKSDTNLISLDANKLWVNLTSDNGVFSQALIGYLPNATDLDDGLYFDAPRLHSNVSSAIIYSTIKNSNKKFAVQGKDGKSLKNKEIIEIGFSTGIEKPTTYNLSLAKFQGEFLSKNAIYLKDKFTNKWHDLKGSDYKFTTESGEFNERFEIVFSKNEFNNNKLNNNLVSISSLGNNNVNFKSSEDLVIKKIRIYEALLGKQLYNYKGNSSSETVTISRLTNTFFIAKIDLSNGITITRKIVL